MRASEPLLQPPTGDLSGYDRAQIKTYLRLLDAETAGATWQEAVRHIFGRDPNSDADVLERMHAAHLARARWMRDSGYLQLLAHPAD